MGSVQVEFHPEAVEEARSARIWYADRSPSAASAFLQELDDAITRVKGAPGIGVRYLYGTQRYLFRRFPFSMVYRERDGQIQVIAFAHAKRRPGYWKAR